ncbi:type VI secretion system baseplate subunit TssE [Paraburkholderia sp. IW21]|uniref:type VI secretion system baseplate subunit TssE n=1 Tax=Paraburkholderia sp. IW21 TaxID=3242488 RepID=UPI0035223F7B
MRSQRDPATARRDSRFDVQPCLLDRLITHRSQTGVASGGPFALSRALLREAVLRDLNWLLNSTNLEATDNLDAYPHVRRSVVNFGLGPLAGARLSALDRTGIESAIREAIVQFEPRFLAGSVEVRCAAEPATLQRNTLSIEVSGQLWSSEAPQMFLIHSEIDLESGHIALRSHGNE